MCAPCVWTYGSTRHDHTGRNYIGHRRACTAARAHACIRVCARPPQPGSNAAHRTHPVTAHLQGMARPHGTAPARHGTTPPYRIAPCVHTDGRTHARTSARTRARTHARTHARTQVRRLNYENEELRVELGRQVCVDMCVDMCADTCVDGCGYFSRHVYRRTYKHGYRHVQACIWACIWACMDICMGMGISTNV